MEVGTHEEPHTGRERGTKWKIVETCIRNGDGPGKLKVGPDTRGKKRHLCDVPRDLLSDDTGLNLLVGENRNLMQDHKGL